MKDNQPPQGQIPPDADGQVGVNLEADHQHGVVRIRFQKSVTWMALPPDLARDFARHMLKMAEQIDQAEDFITWAVFSNPDDHPGLWVARKFKGLRPTGEHYIAPSRSDVRRMIPGIENLVIIERNEGDPPNLVETWI